jgi:RecB family endonuclease NucS
MERILLIKIPEKMMMERLEWLFDVDSTREGIVRAYTLKHPEIIDKNLTIENLVTLNARFNKFKEEDEDFFQHQREVDIMFEKDGTYYLVETKRYKQHVKAQKQLREVIECFKSDFKKHRQSYKSLVPVIVTTDDIDEIETKWI